MKRRGSGQAKDEVVAGVGTARRSSLPSKADEPSDAPGSDPMPTSPPEPRHQDAVMRDNRRAQARDSRRRLEVDGGAEGAWGVRQEGTQGAATAPDSRRSIATRHPLLGRAMDQRGGAARTSDVLQAPAQGRMAERRANHVVIEGPAARGGASSGARSQTGRRDGRGDGQGSGHAAAGQGQATDWAGPWALKRDGEATPADPSHGGRHNTTPEATPGQAAGAGAPSGAEPAGSARALPSTDMNRRSCPSYTVAFSQEDRVAVLGLTTPRLSTHSVEFEMEPAGTNQLVAGAPREEQGAGRDSAAGRGTGNRHRDAWTQAVAWMDRGSVIQDSYITDIDLTFGERRAPDGSSFFDLTMEERRSGCKAELGRGTGGPPPADDDDAGTDGRDGVPAEGAAAREGGDSSGARMGETGQQCAGPSSGAGGGRGASGGSSRGGAPWGGAARPAPAGHGSG